MISIRQQFAMLAVFVIAGVAVGSPVSRTVSLGLVGLLLMGVALLALMGRFGARSIAFGFLVVAGFLAPMNALRLAPSITLADLFLVPSAVLAVAARHNAPPARRHERYSARPDVVAALLLIGGGLIGSQFAFDLGASLSAILRFGLAAVGVPFVFIALSPTRRELRGLAWAFLVGAAVNSVVGVITYHPSYRGIGLSTHSNHLALACVFASGFAAGLFLTSSRRQALVAAGCWAVVTVGILKSGSRAGAAGVAILILAVMFFTGSTRILRWCLVVFIGVATLLHFNVIPYDEQDAVARLLGRDSSAVDASNVERAALRDEAIKSVKQHPLTGAGFEEARLAHNVYLQIWGAAGIVGLLGVAVLWNASVRGLFEGASDDRWLLGAAAAAVSYLIVAAASNVIWDRYLWYGLALFLTGRAQRNLLVAPPPARRVTRRPRAVGPLVSR